MSVDADARAFLDAAGISDTTIENAIVDLVRDMKSADNWSRSVAVYPFVGGTAAAHKYNLVNPVDTDDGKRLTFTGGFTHADTGITPNGTTGYANTHINPNKDITQRSVSVGYYSRDNTAPSTDAMLCGAKTHLLFDLYSTSQIDVQNTFTLANGNVMSLTATGQTNFNRLIGYSVVNDSQKIFRDKVALKEDSREIYGYWSNTGTVASRELWLFGMNNGGSLAFPTFRECAFFFVSYGMGTTRWNAMSDAVTTFQAALGRNV